MPSPFKEAATPLEILDNAISYVTAFADRHERFAVYSTAFIGLSGAAVPVSLIAGERYSHFFFGLLLPSALAVIAALVSGWITLARPFEKWRLFRKVQFVSELERAKYLHHVGRYVNSDRDVQLLGYVEETLGLVLDSWGELLPTTADAARALGEAQSSEGASF